MLDSLVRLSLSFSICLWVHKSQKRHVDGETSECIYISGLYWITSYPWQTLVVVSQTPGSLIYTFTFLFLSAKDYLRLNGLAIHNLSYCGPSFPDTVSLFFRGDGLVGATLFCTSRPSWLSMRDFPWFGHQHHIHAGRERDQLPGWLAASTYARPLEMPNSFPLQDFALLFCWCLCRSVVMYCCRPAMAIYFHFATSYPKPQVIELFR